MKTTWKPPASEEILATLAEQLAATPTIERKAIEMLLDVQAKAQFVLATVKHTHAVRVEWPVHRHPHQAAMRISWKVPGRIRRHTITFVVDGRSDKTIQFDKRKVLLSEVTDRMVETVVDSIAEASA